MITRYDDFWKFIENVRSLHNIIVVVPEHFEKYIIEMNTENYKSFKNILEKNNIKVLEMKNNVKSNFKAK